MQLSNGTHFSFTSIVQGTSFKVDIKITVATTLASEESPSEFVQIQPKDNLNYFVLERFFAV